MITPGTRFPDFKTRACVSIEPGKEFKDISSNDFPGQWLVLYAYPKDFTFVCPTEIVEFDRKLSAFKAKNAVVLGSSTDNEYSHLAWRESNPELKTLNHPLLFLSPAMAQGLGILHPTEGVALRATLIVDPDKMVRFAAAYDLDVGRNVDEVLRALEGLQTGQLVACNWQPGEETLSQKRSRQR